MDGSTVVTDRKRSNDRELWHFLPSARYPDVFYDSCAVRYSIEVPRIYSQFQPSRRLITQNPTVMKSNSLYNTNNPHICQVSATYAPTQVMMNLKACDDGLVASAVPVGAIVGGVVGGVVFVTLVVILIIYFVKRQQRKQMTKDLETKLERANHYSKARSKNVGSEATSWSVCIIGTI